MIGVQDTIIRLLNISHLIIPIKDVDERFASKMMHHDNKSIQMPMRDEFIVYAQGALCKRACVIASEFVTLWLLRRSSA